MLCEVNFGRDPAEFVEASYTAHPVDEIEPLLEADGISSNAAMRLALRYHCGLESRPYGVVAQEVNLHPETIRRCVVKLSERLGTRAPAQRSQANSEKCRQAQIGHPNYNRKKKIPTSGINP
jgi:hypothetical protein